MGKYDYDSSGHKDQQRILNLRANKRETWIWTISGQKGFQKDAADLLSYDGFEARDGTKALGYSLA